MKYLDFELKIGLGTGGRNYPVSVVRSPGGEKNATIHFPYDTLALQSRLQAVEIALLKSGGTHRSMNFSAERGNVQDFGKDLFESLFVSEILSCYRVSRDRARKDGKGLRLRLRIEDPTLASLPWEFLYDNSEGDYICLSNETPVIRYIEMDQPPEPIEIELPLRILGMIASPTNQPALDVEVEKQRMELALEKLSATGLVELTWLGGQTCNDLQNALLHGPWHVFHFIGHGGFDEFDGEGFIALADENGKTFPLAATKLGRLLNDHRSLRLVILNACSGAKSSETDIFSSTASVLMRRGIPAVVAMQFEVSDKAAIQFARTFYQAIAGGIPIDTAVAEGRKAISMSVSNTVEWGTPVLHLRAPDGVLFNVQPSNAKPVVTEPPIQVEPEKKLPPPHSKANGKAWIYAVGFAVLTIATFLYWSTTNEPGVITTDLKSADPEKETALITTDRNSPDSAKPKTDNSPTLVPAKPEIITFVISPPSIRWGDRVRVSWQTKNASRITLNDELVDGPSGYRIFRPEVQTEYTLEASAVNGTKPIKRSLIAWVGMPPAPNMDLAASVTTVLPGGSIVLSWKSTTSTHCAASGDWSGSRSTSGQETIGPLVTNGTFVMTCTGPGGSASDSITIDIAYPGGG